MANTKPFVAAACLAESVLIEKDEVASVIRIADTFFVHLPENLPETIKPAMILTAFISVKSGDLKGAFDLELVLRPPSKEPQSLAIRPVVLEGGVHGANMRIQLNLIGVEMEKTYWLDVLWDKNREILTSIPFRFKPAELSKEQTA